MEMTDVERCGISLAAAIHIHITLMPYKSFSESAPQMIMMMKMAVGFNYVAYTIEAGNTFNDGKETILGVNNTEGTVTLNEGNILRVEYSLIIMTKGSGFTFD